MNSTKSDPSVESYRLDQIEKSFEKFSARIENKIDKITEIFATRAALENAVAERNQKILDIDNRIDKLEEKKRLQTTVTYVILGCSLIANLFMVYEIFTKGV